MALRIATGPISCTSRASQQLSSINRLSSALRPLICHSLSGNRKGFGDAKSASDEKTRKVAKGKRVSIRREEAPIPNQGNLDLGGGAITAALSVEDELKRKEEEAEFAKRLAVVRMEGQERRRDVKVGSAAAGGANEPVFDAGRLDYSSPPSLSDTLMTQLNSDVSDPALKTANIGPNQIGIAGVAGENRQKYLGQGPGQGDNIF